MKFIFVSGGVISGLGKGITTASIALLLKDLGFKVAPVKIDMYLNVDAGTIRPLEHGETFVTKDGLETDEDIGHYERFLGQDLVRENYITTGQIYQEVIRKERAMEYEGEDVEAIPHLTDEIIRRIRLAGQKTKANFVVVELGGTVGEYQNGIFFEASRILKLKHPDDVLHVHVTYLPLIASLGELKSKPAQTSVHILNGMGIHPDIIVARSEKPIDQRRLDRLALFTNVNPDCIFPTPDVGCIYEVPLKLANAEGGITKIIFEKLKIHNKSRPRLQKWRRMAEKATKTGRKEVTVAMVAKYYKSGDGHLADAYISVLEAIKHAGNELGITVNLKWINSDGLEKEKDIASIFKNISGVIVPQGWGSRGVEGKIAAIKFVRENKMPYLGLCFGMQMAVIEFARHVANLKNANSTEVDPKTAHPVIAVMPDQAQYLAKKQYGGTIRLGQWPSKILNSQFSIFNECYKRYGHFCSGYYDGVIALERHRHRYEFNNKYREILEKNGLRVAATSPDGKLVEAIELPNHPFFIGTQYHPELQSRPMAPHPLFLGFLEAVVKRG